MVVGRHLDIKVGNSEKSGFEEVNLEVSIYRHRSQEDFLGSQAFEGLNLGAIIHLEVWVMLTTSQSLIRSK